MHRSRLLCSIAVALACLLAANVIAQEGTASVALERQIHQAFDDADYARAARLIERHLETSPNDAVMLYNAACAQCRLEDHDAAASYLYRAMKAGFRDFSHMRSDPDLAGLRKHPTYVRILEALDKAAGDKANGALEKWRATYGTEHYNYELDEKRRLAYASALDRTSHLEMRSMLERQADHLSEFLFGEPPDYYVLIAVPTPRDAREILPEDNIGGIYEHGRRRLIARDIGGSLRHEFFHAMHYGHMSRLNQPHPIWIQEGLAALYEDYELAPDGSVRFLHNERHNIMKNRQRSSRLTKWRDLFAMSGDRFMRRAGAYYPQVRSIFQFVADNGKLQTWYRTYTETFDEDASGKLAFERTFGLPLDTIEQSWRRWLKEQPRVDMVIEQGDASLGVESSMARTENDGVRVSRVLPRSAAGLAGVRMGDVIVAVDGQSTRSFNELVNIVAAKEVGDTVRLRLRRRGEYRTVSVRLRPHRGG
jgi:hypothetical protein